MEYETVESLCTYLQGLDQSKKINISPLWVTYFRVTFTGSKSQQQVHVINHEWNNLNFSANCNSTVKEVCEFLIAWLPRHAKSTVTIGSQLISLSKTSIVLPTVSEIRWYDTHLNPFKGIDDLQAELDKLVAIVKTDTDIILRWIAKRVPATFKVYQVETEFYIGLNNLTEKYELYDDTKFGEKLFKVDPERPNIYVCRVSVETMTDLFVPKSMAAIEEKVRALQV